MSPAQRCTRRCRISTEATPAAASGSSIDHELKPKMRPDRACTHRAAGGLSTVMKLPGSIEPKKKAFQLTVADSHGGGVVAVGVADRRQAPGVEHGGQGTDGGGDPARPADPAGRSRPGRPHGWAPGSSPTRAVPRVGGPGRLGVDGGCRGRVGSRWSPSRLPSAAHGWRGLSGSSIDGPPQSELGMPWVLPPTWWAGRAARTVRRRAGGPPDGMPGWGDEPRRARSGPPSGARREPPRFRLLSGAAHRAPQPPSDPGHGGRSGDGGVRRRAARGQRAAAAARRRALTTLVVPVWNGNEFLLSDGSPTGDPHAHPPPAIVPRSHELDVEVVLHGDGPASGWAREAEAGVAGGPVGPGRGYVVDPAAVDLILLPATRPPCRR